MYAAFGRGDVPAILEHLAEDVRWDAESTATDIPWLVPRHGPAEVAGFFRELQALEFESFQPTAMLEQGDLVVVLVDLVAVVRQTGRRITEKDEVHLWRFDASGKVKSFRHRADTLAHWRALQP
jgi:ketosteroid isomerase-like protein